MNNEEWLDSLVDRHQGELKHGAAAVVFRSDYNRLIHLARKGLAVEKLATQSKNLVYNAKQVLPEIKTGEVDPGLSFMYCIDLTEEALAAYDAATKGENDD